MKGQQRHHYGFANKVRLECGHETTVMSTKSVPKKPKCGACRCRRRVIGIAVRGG